MRQIDDLTFNILLQCIYVSSLTDTNIAMLNTNVAKKFLFYNLLKNTIIVQKNKFRHMIN